MAAQYLLNSILSWVMKKRFHQIELFMKYPGDVQNEVLDKLLQAAKETEIGKQYDFRSIKNYEDFRTTVPLHSYEDLEPLIERTRKGEQRLLWPSKINWFAMSSGTTNAKSKFIPVSEESLHDCHYKAGKDMLSIFVNNNPDTQIFAGKSLRLGGSQSVYEHNESSFGDLSAIIIDNLPWWAEFRTTPSHKTSMMSEWESKLGAIVDEVLDENVTSLAGVPSWMMVLLNRALEQSGKDNLMELWPNLELYLHGGVAFGPYADQYKAIIPKDDMRYYEIYNASEGFFGIQDTNFNKDMLLMLDYGIFFEFIPMSEFGRENPKTLPIWEVEKDVNYAIVITTNGGLWRYLIGDTVKFTSISPYRIVITGRTKHFINTFGEELIIENAESGLKQACERTGAKIKEYTAGPVYMTGKESGAHEWIIEFTTPPDSLEHFTETLDNALKAVNSDYEAKRYQNMTLNPPVVHAARKGLFYDWMEKRGKLGGQNKVPRLANNRDYLDQLLEMNK